jgi:hypothetical protein
MAVLRQGTSGIVACGPMYKATDGVTVATGYTTNTLSITFYHMGATSTGDWATYAYTTGQQLTEIDRGMYSMGISSNPSSSIGAWRILFDATASGISFWEDYYVLSQKTFDGLYGSGFIGAIDVNLKYFGSTLTTMASGIMTTSATAFNVLVKYVGSSNTTFASGVMATSVSALRVMQNYWGSSGTTVTSGMMTSSRDAFMVAAKYWGTSTGMAVSSGSMTSSKNAIIALVDYWGATGNAISTSLGTGTRTFQELLYGMSNYLWGDATYDGTTAVYYSSGSTAVWQYVLSTSKRTVTTN